MSQGIIQIEENNGFFLFFIFFKKIKKNEKGNKVNNTEPDKCSKTI